jgi:hypothetical protein
MLDDSCRELRVIGLRDEVHVGASRTNDHRSLSLDRFRRMLGRGA